MTVSVNTSGSQAAVIGTDHTLATISAAGTYQLAVDVSAMQGGTTPDILQLSVYSKARSTDTERLAFPPQILIGAQNVGLSVSIPFGAASADYVVKLKQLQGTGRAYPWAVYQY